jgi:creatinine amidohydrolase/Fe(II)-dependent formamide hydrolase-like protein/sterol desaturase/sphingolipid hydroxylase (fatty acid hydroxylase superfamily)
VNFASALDFVSQQAKRLTEVVSAPSERLFGLYLLSAIVLAAGVYWERNEERSLRGFVRWLFPREIYAHVSAKADYAFLIINRLLYPLLVVPFLFAGGAVFLAVREGVEALAGGAVLNVPPGLALDLAFSFYTIVAIDLGLFIGHYLMHRVPFLWEFHKIHHSAQVMTPVTVFRTHPVDDIMNPSALCAGIAQGLWVALIPTTGSLITVLQLDVTLFVFYVVGYNLRHSHVWLDFGVFERIFVSPAMHQIHHSVDPRHHDTNFGFVFSFWDRAVGSLVLSNEADEAEIEFGIGDESEEYHYVSRLYFLPFRKIAARWREMFDMNRPTRLLVIAVLATGLGLTYLGTRGQPKDKSPVKLEQLTWQEVRDRIAAGSTTVIVPTGGTEQNGPHVVLGKHNRIVDYAAGQIARRLGKTLVAPVMAYVPEGDIDPPTDHMSKQGTLTLDEETFERVLEQTARSLEHHGFRRICFLGDSYGNQDAQARVAARLNAEWSKKGVVVIHVSAYYAANGQAEWLLKQGETPETIGGHAGIRDTSELMYVDPTGVRWDKRAPNGGSDFETSGVDGDPTRATRQRGKRLIELKIKAAIKQIQEVGQLPPAEVAPVTSETKPTESSPSPKRVPQG